MVPSPSPRLTRIIWHSDPRRKSGKTCRHDNFNFNFKLSLQLAQTWKCGPTNSFLQMLFCIFIVCQCALWQPLIIFILGRCPATIFNTKQSIAFLFLADAEPAGRGQPQRKQGKTAHRLIVYLKTLRKSWEFRKNLGNLQTQRHDLAEVSTFHLVSFGKERCLLIEAETRFLYLILRHY